MMLILRKNSAYKNKAKTKEKKRRGKYISPFLTKINHGKRNKKQIRV